jgi:hypothetical protein
MANKRTDDERLERAMNVLAESVLSLSDDAILAEVREAGCDPEEEAEHTRLLLREVYNAQAFGGPCSQGMQYPISERKVSSLKR